ncbi:hypothetical protein J116_026445 [Streptomyces thermolilacinus SPC6]|uniref:Uncharacterized protein n=1 Tax=Streptomyces thermolilacinus SPC6 TaxID=1306406 RepID=A0A1D3DYS0_9ACTN|nr:hypothetical protein J116_026445 [Streptomyces thermolilacinus SPC6]
MPAQQVGRQVAEVVPDAGRDVPAVRTCQGARVGSDVEARGGARPAQSPVRRRAVAVSIMEGGTAYSRTRSHRERREFPFAVVVGISTHLARTGPPISGHVRSSSRRS